MRLVSLVCLIALWQSTHAVNLRGLTQNHLASIDSPGFDLASIMELLHTTEQEADSKTERLERTTPTSSDLAELQAKKVLLVSQINTVKALMGSSVPSVLKSSLNTALSSLNEMLETVERSLDS